MYTWLAFPPVMPGYWMGLVPSPPEPGFVWFLRYGAANRAAEQPGGGGGAGAGAPAGAGAGAPAGAGAGAPAGAGAGASAGAGARPGAAPGVPGAPVPVPFPGMAGVPTPLQPVQFLVMHYGPTLILGPAPLQPGAGPGGPGV